MADAAVPPRVEDWKTDLDHFDPRFIQDPYPIYEELRNECPVAHSDRYNGINWVTKAADVAAVAHDTATFSSRRVAVNEIPTHHPGLILPPINLDPPDHTERRRLLLPFFTPKATALWESAIREICTGLLDGLEGRTEIDAAVEYAQEIPGDITARMLGVPASDGPLFRHWLHELLEVGPNDSKVARDTTSLMMKYLLDLVERRRAEGDQGDLVSFLLSQEINGSALTDDEMGRTLFLLLIAGIDTTWSAIGFSLLHLSTHPEDRRKLQDDPSIMPSAIEEFLRAYSPVWVARLPGTDAEVSGCPIAAGEWTVLAFPSANRDPELFDDPDTVILEREQNRHSAFGLGVHRCLGSNLARLEMQIAIEMWMERFPEFTLADPDAVTYSGGNVRGPRRIPVTID
ncbi:MAG: cytochrome P450 [Candidatus Poriferisodalaceae bacterium]|jgi:cytochrome P450